MTTIEQPTTSEAAAPLAAGWSCPVCGQTAAESKPQPVPIDEARRRWPYLAANHPDFAEGAKWTTVGICGDCADDATKDLVRPARVAAAAALSSATDPAYSAPNKAAAIEEMLLSWITASAINPRTHFDEGQLEELAASLREHGMLEPIVVREIPEAGPTEPQYSIIAGERRWRAAQLARMTMVPVRILLDIDDKEALKLALVENLQRADLDPIEEAEGYRQLNRVLGLKQVEIAAAVKRSQPAVAKAMSLLDLPEDVAEHIRAGRLTVAHGVALAKFKKWPAACSAIAKKAIDTGTPSHALERGIPNAYDLDRAGVLKILNAYDAHFDIKAACEHCPFGAYRPMANSYDVCLNPAHYNELKAAAQEERRREVEARVAAAATEGAPMLKVEDLDYKSYRHVHDPAPAGCDASCPCRTCALGYGGRVETICTNPARFEALKGAEQKREAAEREEAYTRRLAALAARLDAVDATDTKALALIVRAAVSRLAADEVKPAIAERGLSIKSQQLTDYYFNAGGAAGLAALSPDEQIRLGLYALLRTELAHERAYGKTDKKTDKRSGYRWYMGELGDDDAAPETAAGEGVS